MAILSKGTTYADGDQITSTNLNALVDSATFAAGAVESGGGLQLNGSGQLKVAGNIDIGTSNLTATGSISLGATTFNDNNITNVGSIAVDTIIADNTDVTIDAAGDITLDAGGADIRLKDDGTQFGRLANSSSNLVVASSISDQDILFQGSDGGSTITALTLDMSAAGAATFNDKITAVGTSVFTNLDISGDVDVDGTINLDAVDIDGNVQIDGTVTVGVDDTGYDVKFFGATSGAYIQFDASADKLLTAGGATIDIVKDKLLIGGTAVTTTAAELNVLDGVTAGTVTASKGIVVDSNKDVSSFRNITLTGELDAGSLDVSGDIDVDGTANLDAVDIDGAVDMASTLTVADDANFDSGTLFVDASTNRVGIGTTSPGSELEVKGSGSEVFINSSDSAFSRVAHQHNGTSIWTTGTRSASDYHIFRESGSGNVIIDNGTLSCVLASGVTATTQSPSDSSTKVATTAYVDAATGGGSGGGAFSTLTATGDVNFDSGTFFVDASADRVGIGTTSPSHKLHLSEASTDFAALITNSTSSGNGLKINAGDNSGDRVIELNDKDGNALMRVGATGLVGIGTNSPSNTLHVVNTSSSGAYIQYDGQSNTEFGLRIESNVSGGNFEGDFSNNGSLLDLFANSSSTTGGDILACRTQSATPVMLVRGNGRVGIGHSTPDEALQVVGNIRIGDDSVADMVLKGGVTPAVSVGGSSEAAIITTKGVSGGAFHVGVEVPANDANDGFYVATDANTDGTVDTVALKIRADGNVGLNNTSPSSRLEIGDGTGTSDHVYHNKSGSGVFPGITNTTSHGIMLESQGSNGSTLHVSRVNDVAGNFARQGTGDVVVFRNTSGSVTEAGSIEITGATSVAYQTSSDYRLKENVVDVSDGIDRVKQLNPVRFNFIGEDRIVDGFLAHEVSDVVPEAIGGEKDAMKDEEYEVSPAVYNEEGDLVTEAVMGTRSVPDYQGIDQSKLVPILTAALQEAVAKIEALEARVQTLEG